MNESAPYGPRKRTKYEGMLNVVRFNRPMYLKALAAALVTSVAAAASTATNQTNFLTIPLWLGAATSVYFICTSILASHIAYDRSGLYDFDWLTEILGTSGGAANSTGELKQTGSGEFNIVNIHTGLDEGTPYLKKISRDLGDKINTDTAKITVIDMYDRNRTPEPSITVANKLYPATYPDDIQVLHCGPTDWPIEDQSVDLALLFLSAHELRRPQQKDQLFGELARVLRGGGQLILVEHLRDLPNFMAFGPGFMHFFPRSEWLRATKNGGFNLRSERKISPFIHLFHLQK